VSRLAAAQLRVRTCRCGVCGGDGMGFDIYGKCCPKSGMWTNQKACCEAGHIDDCGVCGGSGDTCASAVSTQCADTSESVLPPPELLRFRRRLTTVAGDTSYAELVFQALAMGALKYPANLVTVFETKRPDLGDHVSDVRACWTPGALLWGKQCSLLNAVAHRWH
jgi:hypothetical protein